MEQQLNYTELDEDGFSLEAQDPTAVRKAIEDQIGHRIASMLREDSIGSTKGIIRRFNAFWVRHVFAKKLYLEGETLARASEGGMFDYDPELGLSGSLVKAHVATKMNVIATETIKNLVCEANSDLQDEIDDLRNSIRDAVKLLDGVRASSKNLTRARATLTDALVSNEPEDE